MRALDIAERKRLPMITLVESDGAGLPRQTDIFVPGSRTFLELTRVTAAGIPTVSLVLGSFTGDAYVPRMSRYTVLVNLC
ncbi:carboxyl transferase domain-containing protein [Rhodococcus sp. ZPP]|uniref:carboxyl transferase domain-containing protein n=1 Tax=Rhodococcus sp. ZPP TaxID=2749906 RepID=UPI001FCDF8A4|nr:carboxyl transferase domain-containing protein [Rhodococcus sp. ZPP]